MCKIIGPAFVQYLPIVMGPLMQAASIKPEIAIIDCEEGSVCVCVCVCECVCVCVCV